MNRLDEQYQCLLKDILEYGVDKNDRTGTGTKSIFGYTIHHNMRNGFPLLTTKKVPFKTMATELMWFLMGDTNIKYLVDNDCHIWDGDAYKNYLKNYEVISENLNKWQKENIPPLTQEQFIHAIKTDDKFAKQWGELGPIYGKQWRSWEVDTSYLGDGEWTAGKDIDQIANLIEELKTNPDSRRLMVNAWNVGELDQMVLPPCHYGFQVYTRELSLEERLDLASKTYDVFDPLDFSIPAKVDHDEIDKLYPVPKRAISLMWNQRSVDVFLGLPFNIASYGLLLEMIAREVNMMPENLIGHLGDTHLYSNHIEQAKEQMSREPKELPTLKMSSGHNFRAALKSKADEIDLDDFILINYNPHPTIKAPLSN
jgi:thymidylate synthase